jgi:hypothetical protein
VGWSTPAAWGYRLAVWLGCAAAFALVYRAAAWPPEGLRSLWPAWPIGRFAVPRLALERGAVLADTLVVYATVLPATLAAVLAAPTAFALRRLVRAFAIALAVCAVTFVLVPTEVPRDAPVRGSLVAVEALAALRALDGPHNALPSLHVAIAALCAASLARGASRPHRAAAAVWVAAVWASTALTGQHAIVDGAAGLGVAAVASLFSGGPDAHRPG